MTAPRRQTPEPATAGAAPSPRPGGADRPDARSSRRSVRVFAAASFLHDFGSDIITPVWPLFVTQVLKADMAALGFLDGLGEALVSLSSAAAGYVSDRIRRRKVFVWLGYLFGGASRLGYAVSRAWPQLVPFRILDRSGKMRSAPRDAILADVSADRERGRNFGLIRAMDNLGGTFGVLTAIALTGLLGYRLLFSLAAIPSLAGAALILVGIRERREAGGRIFKGYTFRDVDRNLALYIVANGLFALGAFSYSFLLIFAKDRGFRAGAVPVLYLVFTLVAALFSLPMGRLSDRVGRKAVLFAAFGLWAGVCGVAVARPAPAAAAALFVIYGLHKAALDPVQRALAAELAPVRFRASVLGAFQLVVGSAAFPASLAAGWLWDVAGPTAPFVLSLALTGAAVLVLSFVREAPRAAVSD